MKEYQILVKDHGLEFLDSYYSTYVRDTPLWLAGYTLDTDGEFMLKFVEDRGESYYFEEDDYIIEVCRNKFKRVEFIEVPTETIKIFPVEGVYDCQGSDGP